MKILSICSKNDIYSLARTSIVPASILLTVLLSVCCAAAAVTDLQISPENPYVGDSVTIYGTASPNEVLSASVTFVQNAAASNGEYKYDPGKVSIPKSTTNSIITVKGAKDLTISTKILGIDLHRTLEASAGTATMSMSNIPKGRYDLVVSGKTEGTDPVQVIMTAKINIQADKKGRFKYSYKTDYVPAGEFTIDIGDQTRVVTLSPKTGNKKGAGGGKGEARVIDTQTQPELPLGSLPEVSPETNVTEPNVTEEMMPETEPQSFMDSLSALLDKFLKSLGFD
ncbi:MAG: hypothetical protein A4E24_01475 [Methanomethylovorans sp. PtaU1.Bin093]|uniref:hypothetical protein n=1 Tax=Methanomethylovorans sp. PtaU1.Bin093 TaxID=1811679 RepID=UPI0009C880E8|nr:hypothetical protein [Methanomethylovorans sp. PtaU1.Bin093]OPY19885.1 MAG: hypothetical protein A4E24_01475 [Methanomethylovorans sp. PtaU1.Bin093]